MKFLQAEFASVRYHLAEIRDDWNDPRAHLREAHKSLDAIEVGLQRLPREFAERVNKALSDEVTALAKRGDIEGIIDGLEYAIDLVDLVAAEFEGEGVKA